MRNFSTPKKLSNTMLNIYLVMTGKASLRSCWKITFLYFLSVRWMSAQQNKQAATAMQFVLIPKFDYLLLNKNLKVQFYFSTKLEKFESNLSFSNANKAIFLLLALFEFLPLRYKNNFRLIRWFVTLQMTFSCLI